ncbi:MAG: hypothetical protein KF861_00205 [Planctomycetaceae bacterium]|nr:hypothetical protein [Planctomycetaceae bacterium]
MRSYVNSASGIEGYNFGDAWIHVRFRDGKSYEYRSPPISRHHIEKMKHLADSQDGLNTYINQNRDVYMAGKPVM